MPVIYQAIGYVRSTIRDTLKPEKIRPVIAKIVLETAHASAAKELTTGQYIVVVYHLHQVSTDKREWKPDWMKRRTPARPNPIGVTLAQVIAVDGPQITISGLDAIDSTPVLDIKPYKPVFDIPPVAAEISPPDIRRPMIVLTGGPGGGKSSLIENLRQDPQWADKVVFLPETADLCRFTRVSSKEKLFQNLMVNMQIALEQGLDHTLHQIDQRAIVCHRGSLDPLAFWLKRGWPEDEFFAFTGLSRSEHYHRYTCVLHLETSALGVPEKYTRWPYAHRPEEPEEAILLDRYLEKAWGTHPRYYKIDNRHKDWESKSEAAMDILSNIVGYSKT